MDLVVKSLSINFDKISEDSYVRQIDSIRNLEKLDFEKNVTFFVGENGSGKSTLLEAIAIAYGFNPEGGTLNYRFSTYDSHSELSDAIRLSKGALKNKWGYFLRAESFYNVATKEDEYSKMPGGVPQHYHEKSHGESFLALAGNSFRQRGLYILDEPEAALSPQRQLSLMVLIDRAVKAGAQFIIATHSPILQGFPDADIICFDDRALHRISYEESDSYTITEMFINNRERVLREVLRED